MVLKYKPGDWVLAKAEMIYYKVIKVRCFDNEYDDQEWLNMGAPSEKMYQLDFEQRSATGWYSCRELQEWYPIIDNSKTLEVLYGTKAP